MPYAVPEHATGCQFIALKYTRMGNEGAQTIRSLRDCCCEREHLGRSGQISLIKNREYGAVVVGTREGEHFTLLTVGITSWQGGDNEWRWRVRRGWR